MWIHKILTYTNYRWNNYQSWRRKSGCPRIRSIHFDLDNSSTNFWSGQWASKTVPSFRSVPGSNMCYPMVGKTRRCQLSTVSHDNSWQSWCATYGDLQISGIGPTRQSSPWFWLQINLIRFRKIEHFNNFNVSDTKKGNWGFRVYNCLHIWAYLGGDTSEAPTVFLCHWLHILCRIQKEQSSQ